MPRTCQRLSVQVALTVQPQRLVQNEREYVVAPCVMVREGVLNGGLLTGDAIRACHWDGIPLVVQHPIAADGTPVSANAPEVPQVGRVYRTRYLETQEREHLLTSALAELWLDVATIASLGGEALQALNMIESQTPLDVSTAFFSSSEVQRGSFHGTPYTEIHHDLIADHLALLPGGVGACSWADGCGVPRLNHQQACACQERDTPMETPPLLTRLLAMLRPVRQADGATVLTLNEVDSDIRESLYGALAREMSTDFTPLFIDSLDMENQTFTYRQGERLLQRGWVVENDQIVLTEGSQDVQRHTNFVPVTQEQQEDPMPSAAVHARVTALINDPQSAWQEADRAALEGMSEVQLARLSAGPQPPADPEPEEEPTPEEEPVPEPETVEAAIATLSRHLREPVGDAVRAHAKRKQKAIAALVAAKYPLTPSDLQALSLEKLEKLVPLAQPRVPQYAGQGLPHTPEPEEDDSPPVHVNTFEAVAKLRKERGLM